MFQRPFSFTMEADEIQDIEYTHDLIQQMYQRVRREEITDIVMDIAYLARKDANAFDSDKSELTRSMVENILKWL